MKMIILTLLLLSGPAVAKSDPKLLEIIKVQCDWFNEKISLDNRLDCVTDYVNCAIVGSGETDLTQLNSKCLNAASKRRIHEQLTK